MEAYARVETYEKLQLELQENNEIENAIRKLQKIAVADQWNFAPDILTNVAVCAKRPELNTFVSELKKLKNNYESAENVLFKTTTEHKEQESALSELHLQAVAYLGEHKEDCRCPLCHTEFASWEKLLANIQNIEDGEQDAYEIRLSQAKDNKEKAEKEYSLKFDSMLAAIAELLDTVQNKKEEKKRQMTIDEDWLILNKICENRKTICKENVYTCFNSLQGRMGQIKRQIQQIIEEKDEQENALIKTRNELKEKEQIIELTPEQSGLMKIAEELEADYRTGKITEWKTSYEGYKQKIHETKENLEILDKDHPEIKFLSEAELRTDITTEEELLDRNKAFATNYEPYYKNRDKIVVREKECSEIIEYLRSQESRLRRIVNEEGVNEYLSSWKTKKDEHEQLKADVEEAKRGLEDCRKQQDTKAAELKNALEKYFSQENANIIYQKIDPNSDLTDMQFTLTYSDDGQPQLNYEMTRKKDAENAGYTAELYLSTAQLNAVAFSAFFARALMEKNLEIHSIFIDDPIGSFDDMNILGFVDLIRSIIMHTDAQIIMTTHDSKIFNIMQRKLDSGYHSTRFYRLPDPRIFVEEDI